MKPYNLTGGNPFNPYGGNPFSRKVSGGGHPIAPDGTPNGIPFQPGTNPLDTLHRWNTSPAGFGSLGPAAPPVGMGGDIMSPTSPYGKTPLGPGEFYDPRNGSRVIGLKDDAAKRAYLSGTTVAGNTWSGNAQDKSGQVFNGMGGTFGMEGKDKGRPANSPYYSVSGYANGGPIFGPGTGTSDSIPALIDGKQPARISSGENVDPWDVTWWKGQEFFEKLKTKSREDMAEAGIKPPSGPPPMMGMQGSADTPVRSGSGIPEAGMSARAPLNFAAGGFVNPYADDPGLFVQRQREAYAAPLIADGVTDMGFGMKTLGNKYGTGYAVPEGSPLDTPGPGRFNDGGNTVTAQPGAGLQNVPDIIPSGPWAAPALPFDNQANRANIGYVQGQMAPGAPARRMSEMMNDVNKVALTPRGAPTITVPDARPDFGAGPGRASRGEERFQYGKFQSPEEQRMAAAASRPDSDAALGRPEGMRQTDWNRLKRDPKFLLEERERNLPWQEIPGTDFMRGPRGNVVPTTRMTPTVPPGMEADSVTINGVRYKRPDATKPAGPLKVTAKDQPKNGMEMVRWSDGMILPAARNISPNDKQKQAAYEAVTGQKLDAGNAEHWSDAYYFARGERPPRWTQGTAAPAAPAASGPNERHAAALKANPQQAALFDQKFGAGAAARILGTK